MGYFISQFTKERSKVQHRAGPAVSPSASAQHSLVHIPVITLCHLALNLNSVKKAKTNPEKSSFHLGVWGNCVYVPGTEVSWAYHTMWLCSKYSGAVSQQLGSETYFMHWLGKSSLCLSNKTDHKSYNI